ncbi:MAG TPA: 4-alpha-glucanotransferase [Vampirovibrionales bacterium]
MKTVLSKQERHKSLNILIKFLGLERIIFLLPTTSLATSEANFDFGQGSYDDLIPFIETLSETLGIHEDIDFNFVVEGLPENTRDLVGKDPCPFIPSSDFALDASLVNPKFLLQDKWGYQPKEEASNRLLKLAEKIEKENELKGGNKTNHKYLVHFQEEFMKEAYRLFEELTDEHPNKRKFEQFKKDNAFWLIKDAEYFALIEHYKCNLDLWISKNGKTNISPEAELTSSRKFLEAQDFFKFKQFVVFELRSEVCKFADSHGIELSGNVPIDFGEASIYAKPELFLDEWRLGTPKDSMFPAQAWGKKPLDPLQLFDENSLAEKLTDKIEMPKGLGEAGKLLFRKVYFLGLQNPGGFVLDHAIHLLQLGWLYPKEEGPESAKAGRLGSTPTEKQLAKYSLVKEEQAQEGIIGRDEYNYLKNIKEEDISRTIKLFEKIIIPATKAAGLEAKKIRVEGLGKVPKLAELALKHLHDKYGIGDYSFTQWAELNNLEEERYAPHACPPYNALGCSNHDNAPEFLPDRKEGWIISKLYGSTLNDERRQNLINYFAKHLCWDDEFKRQFTTTLNLNPWEWITINFYKTDSGELNEIGLTLVNKIAKRKKLNKEETEALVEEVKHKNCDDILMHKMNEEDFVEYPPFQLIRTALAALYFSVGCKQVFLSPTFTFMQERMNTPGPLPGGIEAIDNPNWRTRFKKQYKGKQAFTPEWWQLMQNDGFLLNIPQALAIAAKAKLLKTKQGPNNLNELAELEKAIKQNLV